MDHSWRPHLPPPPIQGRICPSCSISHFPFCPPPPPFTNPSCSSSASFHYPPPPPPPYQPLPPPPPPPPQPQATAYDPFVDHRSGPHYHPPPTVDSYGVSAYDPFVDHRGGGSHLPPNRPAVDGYGNLLNPTSFDYGNVGVNKRMRIEESTGPFMSVKSTNVASFSADNERRLKLVNEFGAPNQLDTGYSGFDGGKNGDFDGFLGGRNGNSSYSDQSYGHFDRKRPFDHEEHFVRQQYSSRGKGNVQFGQLGYDEVVDNNLPRNNGYKYGGIQDDQQNCEGSRYNLPSHGVSGMNKLYHEQTSSVPPVDDRGYSHHYSEAYAMQNHMESKPKQYGSHYGLPYDQRVNSVDRSGSLYSAQGCKEFASQPPLPASPPPPLPMEPPLRERLVSSSPPGVSASLFPVPSVSSAPLSSSYPALPEDKSTSCYQANYHVPSCSAIEEIHMHHYTSSSINSRGSELPLRDLPSDQSKVIDVSHILKHPYRANRPDHLVIILRGLPGSGKSYMAKMLRELEVENGGTAPRIHSMDDYFMTEVEKVEESEVSKSSGSIRGKKMVTKQVMEYCYEPEMEEAYRSSMLKAFKKTLDEGAFSFVIVDDRNLRVADFAQFWATAKRSGYEVYLLEATYKDPAGCAARNVHGFMRDDVQKMAGLWEEAPSMYLKLDVKSLLHGDALEEGGIQEVDMDMEDDDSLGVPSALDEEKIEKVRVLPQEDIPADGDVKDDQESDHEVGHRITGVKELAKSKWSSDFDEDDTRRNEDASQNLNALSGLMQSYRKEGKSVRWGDQVTKRGFSIGASKATNVSLLIGPGAGYNLKSNPLPEEEKLTSARNSGEPKRHNIFQERLRAEHESFRAVFESIRTGSDKRRQRIVGLAAENE